jgi:hypothetical protein
MFNEETCEQFLVSVLEKARDQSEPTYNNALEKVKAVEIIGERDITLENVGNYAKIMPLITLGILDNRVLNDNSARGDSQFLAYELRVFTFVKNMYADSARQDLARPILRGIRNAFRGLIYSVADGATEGPARIKYTGQVIQGSVGSVALYLQTFDIHTQDHNEQVRTL